MATTPGDGFVWRFPIACGADGGKGKYARRTYLPRAWKTAGRRADLDLAADLVHLRGMAAATDSKRPFAEMMTGRGIAADLARVVGLVAVWQLSERGLADAAGVHPLVLTIFLYMMLHAAIHGAFEPAIGGLQKMGWLLPVTLAGIALVAGTLLLIDRPLWSQRIFSVGSGMQAAISLAMLVAAPRLRLQQVKPEYDFDAERPRHRAETARATTMLAMNEAAIAIGGAGVWVAFVLLHRTVVRRLAVWLVEAAVRWP